MDVTHLVMKSGPFIKAVSEAYKVEEKTVNTVARFLREAGLLTSGARGVNAPDMTPLDAARITIALLATDRPARVVEAVKEYSKLTVNHDCLEGYMPLFARNLADAPTLEAFLEDFFTAQSQTYVEVKRITFHMNVQEVTVETGDTEHRGRVLFDADFAKVKSICASGQHRGRQGAWSIGHLDLTEVALAVNGIS